MATNLINVEYGYGIGQGLIPLAPRPIIARRAPTSHDLAQLGTVWVDVPASSIYILASITSNVPNWTTSAGSGVGAFTSVTVNPGDIDVTAGDVTIAAGNLNVTAGNTTLGGDLTVGGTTTLNGDIDITTTSLFDITSTLDAAPSILLEADGGTSEQIRIYSNQGTSVSSVYLLSDAGGITLRSGLATADGINLEAVGGGVDIDGSLQVNIASSQNAASAIVISSSAGGIDITAAGSAGEDIDISNTASVNLSSSEAVIDAIVLNASNAAGGIDVNAGTGGMTLDTTGAISIDSATASNFTVTGAGQDLTLASSGGSISILSTENAASAVLITSNGGTSETIVLNAVQGTGAGSINLVSDAGGITLTSNLATADGINLNAIAGGVDIDGALQVNIASAQAAAANSVRIVASAADGGMDIDSGTGGMTLDSTGTISIDAATASNFSAAAGDLTLAAATNSVVISGAEAVIDAVQLTASAGAVQVTGGALAATTGLNIVQGAASALVQVGAGIPAHNAPKGSLYLRTDGTTTNNRAYIATDSVGTWTAIVTVA